MDTEGIVPRVLPLLCHELSIDPPPVQRLHLLSFMEHLRWLHLMVIPVPDAADFLCFLFWLMRQEDTGGPRTSTPDNTLRDLAFHVLCRLFQPGNAHFATFLEAMQDVLVRAKKTMEDHFERPPAVPEKQTLHQQIAALKVVLKSGPRTTAPERPPDNAVAPGTPLEVLSSYVVNPAAVELTEQEFISLQAAFNQVADADGRLSLPRLMGAGEQLGGHGFSGELFTNVCLHSGENGTIGFRDVLQGWFPDMSPAQIDPYFATETDASDVPGDDPTDGNAEGGRGWEIEDDSVPAGTLMLPDDPLDIGNVSSRPQSSRPRSSHRGDGAVTARTSVAAPLTIPFGEWGNDGPRMELLASDVTVAPFLQRDDSRWRCIQLLRQLDVSSVFVAQLTDPASLHLYLPTSHWFTTGCRVYRDFITCSRRHRQARPHRQPEAWVHIKTNIGKHDNVMYRFRVEGYNYGKNAVVNSEIVGVASPDPGIGVDGATSVWGGHVAKDHADGATISQYISSDDFVVIALHAESFFNVGFGVSAWFVNHGYGESFDLTATIHHTDDPL